MDTHADKALEDGQGHGIGGDDGVDAGEDELVEQVCGGHVKPLINGMAWGELLTPMRQAIWASCSTVAVGWASQP